MSLVDKLFGNGITNRKIKECELSIIERLENLSIAPGVLDDIVEVIHDELNKIRKVK